MGRTRTLQTLWTLSALTAGLTGTSACDSLVETTTQLTQAITAEDSADVAIWPPCTTPTKAAASTTGSSPPCRPT